MTTLEDVYDAFNYNPDSNVFKQVIESYHMALLSVPTGYSIIGFWYNSKNFAFIGNNNILFSHIYFQHNEWSTNPPVWQIVGYREFTAQGIEIINQYFQDM